MKGMIHPMEVDVLLNPLGKRNFLAVKENAHRASPRMID
jgi:hypothetical protein